MYFILFYNVWRRRIKFNFTIKVYFLYDFIFPDITFLPTKYFDNYHVLTYIT